MQARVYYYYYYYFYYNVMPVMITVMLVNVNSKAIRNSHCFFDWFAKIVAAFLVAVD